MQTAAIDSLLDAAAGGDRAAADVLFGMYRDRLMKYVRGYSVSNEDAEDIVQTAFVRAAGALSQFRRDCSFVTWLTRIATHALYNHWRGRRVRGREAPFSAVFGESGPEVHALAPVEGLSTVEEGPATVDAQLWSGRLWSCARQVCSAEQLRVLTLLGQGETVAEVAELLRMNKHTVSSHRRRGAERLIRFVKRHEADLLEGLL